MTAVTDTKNKTLNTIFDWRSSTIGSSHCLLRLYLNESEKRAIIIASELASNRQNPSITHDIRLLWRIAIRDFNEFLNIENNDVIFLVHYGNFSEPPSYYNLGFPDEFARVDLSDDKEEWMVLSPTEVLEILDGEILEPVEKVLVSLSN